MSTPSNVQDKSSSRENENGPSTEASSSDTNTFPSNHVDSPLAEEKKVSIANVSGQQEDKLLTHGLVAEKRPVEDNHQKSSGVNSRPSEEEQVKSLVEAPKDRSIHSKTKDSTSEEHCLKENSSLLCPNKPQLIPMRNLRSMEWYESNQLASTSYNTIEDGTSEINNTSSSEDFTSDTIGYNSIVSLNTDTPEASPNPDSSSSSDSSSESAKHEGYETKVLGRQSAINNRHKLLPVTTCSGGQEKSLGLTEGTYVNRDALEPFIPTSTCTNTSGSPSGSSSDIPSNDLSDNSLSYVSESLKRPEKHEEIIDTSEIQPDYKKLGISFSKPPKIPRYNNTQIVSEKNKKDNSTKSPTPTSPRQVTWMSVYELMAIAQGTSKPEDEDIQSEMKKKISTQNGDKPKLHIVLKHKKGSRDILEAQIRDENEQVLLSFRPPGSPPAMHHLARVDRGKALTRNKIISSTSNNSSLVPSPTPEGDRTSEPSTAPKKESEVTKSSSDLEQKDKPKGLWRITGTLKGRMSKDRRRAISRDNVKINLKQSDDESHERNDEKGQEHHFKSASKTKTETKEKSSSMPSFEKDQGKGLKTKAGGYFKKISSLVMNRYRQKSSDNSGRERLVKVQD